MKVAILTMFNGLSNTYSLVNVVEDQLKMLLNDRVKVKMLVSEHCPDTERKGIFKDSNIEWIKIVNSKDGKMFHWVTYNDINTTLDKDFYMQAELIKNDFVKYLSDVDVCIMHDIMYQGVHLIHNVAIRNAQKELPNVKFLSFTHSAPVKHKSIEYPINLMYESMPNTTFIYPTSCGLNALSLQYNTDISNCKAINNSIDITNNMSDEILKIKEYNNSIFERDILIVYPGRLTMAKKFHEITEFLSYIKKYCNKSVGVIFADFPSADIPSDTYKFIIKDIGYKNGLLENDIIFTSDCGFINGIKRETVFDLFTLSNLFICPSFSESFGLTVIEAASRGNFIVLNEAVPALEEIGKNIDAYFMRWDAKNFTFDSFEHYVPNKRLYYIKNAQEIVNKMDNNPVIKAKTYARIKYSNEWIYKNQLKPLLKNILQ
ncbi:MAG: glycosyltransferase [Bacilli bacterium]